MDRRRFLQLTAATGAAAAISRPGEVHARPKPARVIQPLNPNGRDTLAPMPTKDVLIIGGGLAGLSAAIELVDRGYQVTIKEAAPVLGGRLSTRDEETGAGQFRVEHGLHMWFYNYHNFKDIRQRLGIDAAFREYN